MVERAAPQLVWTREENPVWNADKQRVIGGAPEGTFTLSFADGDALPGDWWAARTSDGTVVGFGRIDLTWGGDAEILLAVDPERQGEGIGSSILQHLEDEVVSQGVNYVHNRISDHPRRDFVHDWLVVRGFRGPVDSDLRKRVGSNWAARADSKPAHAEEPYDVDSDPGGQGPGREDKGGYVNVDQHNY
ncbi:GNAT family N-acetyltransferase [Nocardioides sp. 1609]|uniref:GNAT family N-acetyltransferase n=1 Tax=Nocardioides sp. 1609 TaxID=2508327 RepID=UPI001070097C|nr:GNAT family N-acetyltransferase [Nocardioides sp. 1609]